ncbi:methyl-accepting chemotaxis protein [Roseibium sp. RKSG952]|uniref:methyl-accepting chemotaxis protein n=1 Tax=Roseibium sp. RKSG952 TaxID=2529384 RepID=UPI0012BBCFD7|nr:methyl-accepting chemotaxis protein [Roseibium sp. RKSG952]MTH97372.1 methyl-accepting chemotaxis protein [Roseibium sp. RKSG952]
MKSGQSAGRKKGLFKLSIVVPALMVGVTLASCVAVGIGGYLNAREGLVQSVESKLELIAKARKELVRQGLNSISSDLSNMATGAGAALALSDMESALSNLDNDRPALEAYFQPEGSTRETRAELDGKDNKTMYAWRHRDLHGSFHSAWMNGGYGDIYILNKDGLVIYSVTKSDDFLETVSGDLLAGTGLAGIFEEAMTAGQGMQVFSVFDRYGPAGDTPSMFLAQPVYVSTITGDKLGGAIVMRIGADYLDKIMANRDGLGDTGQVYMVNSAGAVLTNQPLSDVPTALEKNLSNAVLTEASEGLQASGTVTGPDGQEYLTVVEPMFFGAAQWLIVVERSAEEALASVVEMRNSMLVSTLIVVAISAIIALLFSRSITRPLGSLAAALKDIARGNTEAEIVAANRGDEIGDIGRAVVQIRQNAQDEQERRAARDADAAKQQEDERRQMLSGLATEFETTVGKLVDNVAKSATHLRQSADEMRQVTQTSGETSERAATDAQEAMTEVQSIASASDQLSSSIQQISELIERSTSVAETANSKAQSTNGTVRSLAEAANRIGEVITLISDIADQTNLLALNATIEAARAGEAGRGFAVVASEVKDLASQTAKATGEIQHQVDAIRGATDDAVSAIGDIQQTIGDITASVTEVAAAVTEQSYATKGIAENTQRAASGTSRVSTDIAMVSSMSEQAGHAATNFVDRVSELAEEASHLDSEVGEFLNQVRSA